MCYDLFRKFTCDDLWMILGFPKSRTYDEFTINLRHIYEDPRIILGCFENRAPGFFVIVVQAYRIALYQSIVLVSMMMKWLFN